MLSELEVQRLLDKLCIDLGFCLPPQEQARLIANPPDDARAFTDAAFSAEGLNPQYADRHTYRAVRDYVADAFHHNGGSPKTQASPGNGP
jgi:hypothetical protein